MAERWEEIARELGSYDMEYVGGPYIGGNELVRVDDPHYVGDYVETEAACKRIANAEDRIRAWTDGCEPPPLEDDSAVGPPDIAELIEAAPRFTGDREGGPVSVEMDTYEAVVSRSEIVAYGRALAWQQRRIAELEAACVRKNEDGAAAYEWGQHEKAEVDDLRGLIAECLALHPVVTGDMEKVRVWADVVRRMREAARGKP